MKAWLLAGWTIFLTGGWIIANSLFPDATLPFGVPASLLLVVGGFLSIRVPRNLIGPVLVVGASAWLIYDLGTAFAVFSMGRIEPLPGEYLAAWLGSWTGPLFYLSIATLLVLFPDGRFGGHRKWFLPFLAIALVLALVGALSVWGLPADTLTDLAEGGLFNQAPGSGFTDNAFILSAFLIIPGSVSLLVRYWRGDNLVRQQIKWLIAAVASFPIGVGIVSWVRPEWSDFAIAITVSLVPIAIGIAVMRYRLYDLDRVISRSVTYAIVVGFLGAVFSVGVVVIPTWFGLADSQLLVAGSTLIVAGLFNPLRRRVQVWVDRRFNRSRFEAQHVVEQFADSLRERVETEDLLEGWVRVVAETLQPNALGVWI
ncbi:MAG: hypothetical protein WBM90_10765, partial [Acidimicrobiia bacterium]